MSKRAQKGGFAGDIAICRRKNLFVEVLGFFVNFSSTFSEDFSVFYIGYILESNFHEFASFFKGFRNFNMICARTKTVINGFT